MLYRDRRIHRQVRNAVCQSDYTGAGVQGELLHLPQRVQRLSGKVGLVNDLTNERLHLSRPFHFALKISKIPLLPYQLTKVKLPTNLPREVGGPAIPFTETILSFASS